MERSRTDAEILAEVGRRFRAYRLQQNVSQAGMAVRAGLNTRTVQNLESGADTQLSTVVRVLRALGRLDALDALLPIPRVSPMTLLETQGRGRQRARARARGPRRG
jgi:transcriptional regulator with XRE-family HTH domain